MIWKKFFKKSKPADRVVTVENPAFYYVGYDLDASGNPVNGWCGLKQIDPGHWIGSHSQGTDISIADLNNNGRPDLVFYHIDDPDLHNYSYYRIGFDLDELGNVQGGWSAIARIPGTTGYHNQGGGIAVNPVFFSNGLHDLWAFVIDNPPQWNNGLLAIGGPNP
jgi:hypothetical protein